ncbi:MAG: hypothetical protein G01um101466_276 [Parcubacteria group bacterium Gr01-1014_66]|nr:MAG: hypothetical protein G01um101466_276 [Parcubacteria group bacterium Gr01-1014_66]
MIATQPAHADIPYHVFQNFNVCVKELMPFSFCEGLISSASYHGFVKYPNSLLPSHASE